MIEGLKGASATQSNASLTPESDQTIESVAIAGVAAIQHLITERDSLRVERAPRRTNWLVSVPRTRICAAT